MTDQRFPINIVQGKINRIRQTLGFSAEQCCANGVQSTFQLSAQYNKARCRLGQLLHGQFTGKAETDNCRHVFSAGT